MAALLLLLPLVAMQITGEVHWTPSDFVFAALLLFVPLGLYELVARSTGSVPYRAGVGVALAGAVAVVWISGAVGITDGPADLLFLLAIAAGIGGAFVARFRTRGMAVAAGATALGIVLGGASAATGIVPAEAGAFEIAILTLGFAGVFVVSAALFRMAAREAARPGADEPER